MLGQEHSSKPKAVKWLDDTTLSVGLADGSVEVFDATKGRMKACFRRHSDRINTIETGENAFFTAGKDKIIVSNDLRCKEATDCFLGHTGSVATVTCSQDTNVFASGGINRSVKIWDTRHKSAKFDQSLAEMLDFDGNSVIIDREAFMSFNASRVPCFGENRCLKTEGSVQALEWSPWSRNRLLFGVNTAGNSVVRDYHVEKNSSRELIRLEGEVNGLFWDRVSGNLSCVQNGTENKVTLLDKNMSVLGEFGHHEEPINVKTASKQGNILVTGDGSNTDLREPSLCVWSLSEEKETPKQDFLSYR